MSYDALSIETSYIMHEFKISDMIPLYRLKIITKTITKWRLKEAV